jgi:drug/metabolite transporter (DMT)-like permease
LGNVIPFLLLSYGEQTTGAGLAGVLVGTTPLLTLTLAAAALPTERPTRRTALGLLVGFAGVVLVIGPWRGSLGSAPGQLACLGAALSYAAGFVYVPQVPVPQGARPAGPRRRPARRCRRNPGAGHPVLTWQAPHLTGRVIASILALGLLGTGLAYVLYFRLIGDIGATATSAVNYAVPVFAVLVGVMLLAEPVTWNLIVGGLVAITGMAYAENRIGHARPARPTPPRSTELQTCTPQ